MINRLPPQSGEWIDRDRPVTFRFEGRTYLGYQGDVLSSALWAHDVRFAGRSFKYHRPRGTFSLANHDINVLVEDDCETNLRGDVLPIHEELDVRAVNTSGGLTHDRLGAVQWFSSFLPVGFYYKSFHTPRRLFPFYENQMRKVAGLGTVNPKYRAKATPKDYAFCEVLVVGAGPAGLSAALAAGELGVDVLLAEEMPHAGGSLLWQRAGDQTAQDLRQDTLARLDSLDNVRVRTSTQVAGGYADQWMALVDDRRLTKLRTQSVVAATGCFEQPAVFQNNDLPGVLLGSAAQRLLHLYAVRPFHRAVILAANCDAYRLAVDLNRAGIEIGAIVDLRPAGEPSVWGSRIAELGILVYAGSTVHEAIPDRARTGVQGAVVCQLNDRGEPRNDRVIRVECDGIAVSVGWAPIADIIFQAGGRFSYDESVEQLTPRELPENLFVAGRAGGVFRLEDQLADGRRAGLAAARFLGHTNEPLPERILHCGPPPSHPYPIFAHKKKKNFVDLDEDLHLADFAAAHQEGYDSIELLKRYSTVGMGPSQGKLANMNAVRILARLNGTSINQTGTTTARPFHHPVSLEHLAGRRFHPERRTAMHTWHVQAGAEMVRVGGWLRPEYYGMDGRCREDCILDEARCVRDNVALIDLGTLGKILITGPEACEFLSRIYIGSFSQQKVGTMRYGVACDETGVIMDDGIVARLAEDRFYVTATTSGAAGFYRELQRWAILWNMNVVLVNLTSQMAALNIAGPRSREILSSLADIDLSATAFPYSGAREGHVAGVPATIIRVGFVGELGYEMHFPSSYGMFVWTELLQAGSALTMRPFGVEAQRLLRLEKGHFIVGQDTDALTTPYEANIHPLIAKKKPFFVGKRSLDIVKQRPLGRTLVGYSFPEGYTGPLPKECHLVIDQDQIAGRVTSVANHSTLGHALGLAYVRPDLATPGTRIQIRTQHGHLASAEVTALPFYDPQGRRQR